MKILFVCTGNTCRSCMAEAIFNNLNQIKDNEAFSAGLSVIRGSVTSKNSASVVSNKLNVDISNRAAMQLDKKMIEEADVILTMTEYMSRMIKNELKQYSEKVFPLKQYVGLQGDIIDPYGGSIEVYEKTFVDLKESMELLLKKLTK